MASEKRGESNNKVAILELLTMKHANLSAFTFSAFSRFVVDYLHN